MEKTRLSIDISIEVNKELEKIAKAKGVSKSDIMRSAFELMKLAVAGSSSGDKLCLVNDKNKKIREFII